MVYLSMGIENGTLLGIIENGILRPGPRRGGGIGRPKSLGGIQACRVRTVEDVS